MKAVIQKEGEDRKDYLIRVTIIMLRQNALNMNSIVYDEVECDAYSLANDLEIDFEPIVKK